MEWLLGRWCGHSADYCNLDSHGSGARDGAADHWWTDHHGVQRSVQIYRRGLASYAAVFDLYRCYRVAHSCSIDAKNGAWPVHRVGGLQTDSQPSGRHPVQDVLLAVYMFCGLCAGIAGLILSSNVSSADGNNAGLWYELDAILAVVIGGTSLNGGRFYLMGTLIGALIIQTLTTTIYMIGVPPEITLGGQSVRCLSCVPDPIGAIPQNADAALENPSLFGGAGGEAACLRDNIFRFW